MGFITFLKPALKFVLPYVVKYLLAKAEEEITGAKMGVDKKEKVVAEVADFANKVGFDGLIDDAKLSKLIDNTVDDLSAFFGR